MAGTPRYTSLDGLRGVAAIAVMLFHAVPAAMPGGYLAVDFFFCLSGFVIALAYGRRLDEGLTFETFVRLRLVRLYPMMFVGGVLGIALHGGNPNILLLVPDFMSTSLFPTNPPFWSLLAEVLVNLAFALLLVKLGHGSLLVIVAVSGATLAAGILTGPWPRELGSNWETIPWMLPRTLFSFGLGVLLFRWHQSAEPVRRTSAWAFLMPAAMLAVMAFGPASRAGWDTLAILFVLPTIVWVGTRFEMPMLPLWERLGALSFPLYCIHMPIIYFVADEPFTRLTVAAALLPAALAFDRRYDRRARKWLADRALRTVGGKVVVPCTMVQ